MADPVTGSIPRGNCCNATEAGLRVKGRGKKIMHTKEQLLEENTSSSLCLYTLLYYTVPSSSSSEPPASNVVQLLNTIVTHLPIQTMTVELLSFLPPLFIFNCCT